MSDYWVLEGIVFGNEYPILNIKPYDVVYDVGANIGIFTLLAAKRARLVISIEPEMENFEILKLNVKRNNLKNVILINKAVGDRKGKVSMSDTGGTATVLSEDENDTIELTTLDSIIQETGILPNIIKMDIEGYEVKALNGFTYFKELRELVMEVHSPELLEKVSKILHDNNFKFEDISKPLSFKIGLNLLRYPLCYLHTEHIFGYATTKQILKHFILRSSHPIASANKNIGQYLIRAVKAG